MDSSEKVIKKLRNQLSSVRRRSVAKSERLRIAKKEIVRATTQRISIEQAAVNAIFAVDTKGLIMSWNDAARKVFGYSEQEILGRPAKMLISENHHYGNDEGLRMVAKAIYRHPGRPMEVQGITKAGKEIPIELSLSAWESNGELFYTGIARDVSWRKRSEEQTARHIRQLDETLLGTVEVITRIGEMSDLYTVGHERRVADIATAIAVQIGFNAHRQRGIHIAGRLHDIGKIGLSEKVLSKPGDLRPSEIAYLQDHATLGYEVLKSAKFPWPVAEVAGLHHERSDGSGYPNGLKGNDIPLEARIIAVADVIEAMSSDRPYRKGLGITAALAEIENGTDRLYDGKAAEAALYLFRIKGFTILESRKWP